MGGGRKGRQIARCRAASRDPHHCHTRRRKVEPMNSIARVPTRLARSIRPAIEVVLTPRQLARVFADVEFKALAHYLLTEPSIGAAVRLANGGVATLAYGEGSHLAARGLACQRFGQGVPARGPFAGESHHLASSRSRCAVVSIARCSSAEEADHAAHEAREGNRREAGSQESCGEKANLQALTVSGTACGSRSAGSRVGQGAACSP